MHPAYFDTCFTGVTGDPHWPETFAIITAYAPTGESWSVEANHAADRRLEHTLRARGCWMQRLTGFSPDTGHAEPGWAVALPFAAACDVGLEFHQDAIYFVEEDMLFVSHCDARRKPLVVGRFRERLRMGLNPA